MEAAQSTEQSQALETPRVSDAVSPRPSRKAAHIQPSTTSPTETTEASASLSQTPSAFAQQQNGHITTASQASLAPSDHASGGFSTPRLQPGTYTQAGTQHQGSAWSGPDNVSGQQAAAASAVPTGSAMSGPQQQAYSMQQPRPRAGLSNGSHGAAMPNGGYAAGQQASSGSGSRPPAQGVYQQLMAHSSQQALQRPLPSAYGHPHGSAANPAGSAPQQQYPVTLAQLGLAAPVRAQGAAMLQQIRPGVSQVSLAQQHQARAPGWRGYQLNQPASQQPRPTSTAGPEDRAVVYQSPSAAQPRQPPTTAANSTQRSPNNTAAKKPSQRLSKAAQNAMSAKKHCNCKNSRCLKLYCECFASGRYCDNCNCVSCCNNKENEIFRQAAVETILDRNPNAFRPKIQERDVTAVAALPARHNKGCNCKKSGCLKKYCECFQASIYCSENCKCVDCKNFNAAFGPKVLLSPKAMQRDQKRPAVVGGSGSFTEALNEAIAGEASPGDLERRAAVKALRDTMQEVAAGGGIAEMAKLLVLVADEELETFKQDLPVKDEATSPSGAAEASTRSDAEGEVPANGRLSVAENEALQPGVPSAAYAAQEQAVLHEFHGFLSKLVKKVQRRTAQEEAAAAVGQPSSSTEPGSSGGADQRQSQARPAAAAESAVQQSPVAVEVTKSGTPSPRLVLDGTQNTGEALAAQEALSDL